MIKVCSLDFLNKPYFEADIKIADGRTIIKAGQEITPELILKLYFREIYTDKPLSEYSGPRVAEDITTEKELDKSAPVESETVPENDMTKSPKQAMPDINEMDEKAGPSPIPASLDIDLNKETPESTIPSPKSRYLDEDEDTTTESTNTKGPKFSEIDLESKTSEPKFQAQGKKMFESEEIKPVDENLEYDEEQAKKIAELSIKLGKIINTQDLEDLKNAALYCNIGIKKFKKSDLKKKDFEIFKAAQSAKIAEEDYNISSKALETIRLHPNDYDSNSFSLNQKIPHYHIIGIVYYYEKMLKAGDSKEKILDKMLQLGGNKFNIFVLHKFIKMMKDTDE